MRSQVWRGVPRIRPMVLGCMVNIGMTNVNELELGDSIVGFSIVLERPLAGRPNGNQANPLQHLSLDYFPVGILADHFTIPELPKVTTSHFQADP